MTALALLVFFFTLTHLENIQPQWVAILGICFVIDLIRTLMLFNLWSTLRRKLKMVDPMVSHTNSKDSFSL